MRINLPLRPWGSPWLFEDLQRHLCRVGAEMGHDCVPSEAPVDADAWVVLRTVEVGAVPDPARTVGMVHDFYDDDYGPGQPRHALGACGGIVMTHPGQWKMLARAFNWKEYRNWECRAEHLVVQKCHDCGTQEHKTICRPIGACREFFGVEPHPRAAHFRHEPKRDRVSPDGTFRESLTQFYEERPFTVGWVGRPVSYRGRDVKRLDRLVAAIRELGPPVRVLLIGSNLAAVADQLVAVGASVELHDRYPGRGPWETWAPALYAQMDALLITSEIEAGPMCLFEALAARVPVVSTPCGWAEMLDLPNGSAIYRDVAMAAKVLGWRRRKPPRRSGTPEAPTLDSWCRDVIGLAVEVAK